MKKIGELMAINIKNGDVIKVMGRFFKVIDVMHIDHKTILSCGHNQFEYLNSSKISIYA